MEDIRNAQHPAETEEDIRRSIARHEHSVADLQTEIENLMHGIRTLRFQIIKHEEAIRIHKGKITLARRLPLEILATIFEKCTLDGWTRAPLAVSHVCSEWRRAAQTPAVWSQVYVSVDSPDPYGRTQFWLAKSQSVAIDITIDLQNSAGPIYEIMDLLVLHRSRWRSLTLASFQLTAANDVLQRCADGVYPILRTLRVSVDEEVVPGDSETLSLRDSFDNCPQLRSCIINRNLPPSGRDIPSNITNLSVNLDGLSTILLSVETLMDLLLDLPLLENFSISLAQAQETTFTRDTERLATLPTLKELTLVGQADLFAVLRNVHTPAILRLHLISSAEPIPVSDQWTGLTLSQWVDLGNTSLELLELRDVDVAEDVFIACFTASRDLKTLKLHDSEISDAVIESLHVLCPTLAVLDLRWCGQVTGRALVRFVQSRMVMGSTPIEIITIINCSFVEEQDILDLACNTVCRLVIDLNDHCREQIPHLDAL